MRSLASRCVLILAVLTAAPAGAYEVGSAATTPCHEHMSLVALSRLDSERSARGFLVPLPEDDLWFDVAHRLFADLGIEAALPALALGTQEQRLLTLSFLVGVRLPDTEGHSVLDVNALRRIHSDPGAEGQYVHGLRAEEDDGPRGDAAALERTKALIQRQVEDAALALAGPTDQLLAQTEVYVEHLGVVELPLYRPAVLLGVALHTLQDSYSHMLRSEDLRHVLSVLNFVEAANGTLLPSRDGMAHSRALDDCTDTPLAPLVEAAGQASVALVVAALDLAEGDASGLNAGLQDCSSGPEQCGWLEYAPDCDAKLETAGNLDGSCCSLDGSFCDSPWLPTARRDPTAPFCSNAGTAPSGAAPWPALIPVLSLVLCMARRRRLAGVLAMVLLSAPRAFAGELDPPRVDRLVLGGEGHGSLFGATADRALVDVTFGARLRAGLRWHAPPGQTVFGMFAGLEQSSWLSLEYTSRLDPGVMNAMLGAELLHSHLLHSSVALGSSILLFESVGHDAGTVGLFAELRPLGLLLPLGQDWAISIDPLTVAWVAPGLSAPTLAALQYRCVVGLEWETLVSRRLPPRRR